MADISEQKKVVDADKRRAHGNLAYRPIWEVIDEIMHDVPEAALSRLPDNGAEKHDYYLSDAHEKAPQ